MLIFRVYLLIYLFFYFPLDCPTSILYQCKTDTILKKNKTKTKSLSFPFPLITKPSFKTQITVFSHNHLRKNPKQPNKKKFQNLLHQREMVKQRKKKKKRERRECRIGQDQGQFKSPTMIPCLCKGRCM